MSTSVLLIADDSNDGEGLALARGIAGKLDPRAFPLEVVRLVSGSEGARPIAFADEMAAGETIVPVASRWLFDPRAFWRLKQRVDARRPAVVHTLGDLAGTYGRAAASFAGQNAVVASGLDSDFERFQLPAAFGRRWLAARSTTVVDSDAQREAAIAAGWPSERLRVIAPAAPPFEPPRGVGAARSREEASRMLGVPGDSRLVGVLAPLEPRRRIKEAIWAFDPLWSVRPDARLLVIGRGPQRRELELFRDTQGCRDSVHVVTSAGAAAEWWRHLDAIWSFDPAPRPSFATLRAIASGIPLVATDTPGHRRVAPPGGKAFLVPVGARPAFAQATAPLLDGRGPRKMQEPDWSMVAGQYADLYRSLY